jgi:hypothetical protein
MLVASAAIHPPKYCAPLSLHRSETWLLIPMRAIHLAIGLRTALQCPEHWPSFRQCTIRQMSKLVIVHRQVMATTSLAAAKSCMPKLVCNRSPGLQGAAAASVAGAAAIAWKAA